MPLQNGQLNYYCHLHHADPRVCPVAADGLFQLVRFGVKGQPFPDFVGNNEADWYDAAVSTHGVCALLPRQIS